MGFLDSPLNTEIHSKTKRRLYFKSKDKLGVVRWYSRIDQLVTRKFIVLVVYVVEITVLVMPRNKGHSPCGVK